MHVEQDLPIDCEGSEAKLHIVSHGTVPAGIESLVRLY
jgi:hypothetical protein